MAVTLVLTPVLQKAEKCRFYQEIGGCYKGTIILRNSVSIRSIPFKCIFVRVEKSLMQGKNERKIPLALYIRLEYRPRYQVSVYRTIGPVVINFIGKRKHLWLLNHMAKKDKPILFC